ncbi:GNAT family N-acetyltransferase [Streptomyces sp. RB6PN25]|uniref:GNAT family N-acetyltransferase n=1 Tax=Streptomyces humicola TaxID=2953240 RepID=A0ABT1PTV0_9ACTN|nr:GNAT family N-acetyltransferase [Streptomyces humicola]MCQ4079972.1 GNAT family N-acetyltransferase [Streptomyces humicola]
MDRDAVLAAYDQQMRHNARPDGPGARIERSAGVVRQVGAAGGWNGVVWSDLDRDGVDAAIAAQVSYFTSLGRDFEWKLYAHDRPRDLAARLRAAGFTPEPEETLMAARIEDVPTAVVLPEGVRLRPVTDAVGAELVAEVHEQAFGAGRSRIGHRLRAQLAERPDAVVAVVAMAGEVPVSAARMELYQGTGFAGLWGGGTVTGWRGRGIYRALVAHRARIAADCGYRYLQVDASDQSRPILQRLGFRPLTTTTAYIHRAGR